MRNALMALVLAGCALGYRGGQRPQNNYETLPQARAYEELSRVRANPLRYGISGELALQYAAQRMYDRAMTYGADAVIGVEVRGGCSIWPLFVLAPNCMTEAEGIAVRWITGSDE